MSNTTKNIIEFTLIYNKYKKNIFNFSLRMLNNRMVCEDIVQDVFMRLFENMDNIRNKNSIQFWLFKTVRNEIYNYFRTKKIRVDQFNVEDTDELEAPSEEKLHDEYESKELKQLILSELQKIPFEQSEVFYLKEYGELSYKEIAAVMDITEDLVKSRLFKTRQKLIKRLTKILNEQR
ncbi:RNA polymerase sigma factor [Melioribacteraceae bacterium 4301-Me]|uniref:RNA polymerase sigma factor n=1 Tax=Pyranulibacter aquaticus TaxID=3163344 RepID=UPI00359AE8BD